MLTGAWQPPPSPAWWDYALARFRLAGREAFPLDFLATQLFPSVLLVAPLLAQWHALGLTDAYQVLIYSSMS
jgi:multiple sugar transport system permease protein